MSTCANPRILRSGDIIESATLTASASDTGYPVANTQDWKEYTYVQSSGAATYNIVAELANGALGDTFDNLDSWTETDANGTLSVSGGALTYNSGANANDNPDINQDGTLTVASNFAMELVFDATAFATATSSEWYWELEFAAGYKVRAKVDDNGGSPRITFSRDANAGSYTDVDDYTLGGGTSGRINIERETNGDVTCKVYDDNDSSYHANGTYAGGSNYQSTTLNSHIIEFFVDTRTGGSMTATCATLYHASAQSVDCMGLAGHNFDTVGITRIKLESSVGGVGYAEEIAAFAPPNGDETIAKFFTPTQPFLFLKLTYDNNGGSNFIPQLGIWYVGEKIELPRLSRTPHDPDELEDVNNKLIGGTGYMLEVNHEHTMRKSTYTSNLITQTFIDDTWKPFIFDYRESNFIFVWDATNHSDEARLMRFADNRHTMPYQGLYRDLTFTLEGRMEEEGISA